MSQQGMTVVSASPRRTRRMGDIEYLAVWESRGNILRLQAEISSVGNKLTHTVSVGKDAYVLVAKIVPSGFVTAVIPNINTSPHLNNNHTEAKISIGPAASLSEIDRVTVGMSTSARYSNAGGIGSGYGSMSAGIFHNAIGAKIIAGQLIEIENTLDNGNCRAQMVILEVDTGTSPALS